MTGKRNLEMGELVEFAGIPPISASVFTWLLSRACVSSLLFLYKDTCHWIWTLGTRSLSSCCDLAWLCGEAGFS